MARVCVALGLRLLAHGLWLLFVMVVSTPL